MTTKKTDWPAAIVGIAGLLTAIAFGLWSLAWIFVLPVVGLLYFLGALA